MVWHCPKVLEAFKSKFCSRTSRGDEVEEDEEDEDDCTSAVPSSW